MSCRSLYSEKFSWKCAVFHLRGISLRVKMDIGFFSALIFYCKTAPTAFNVLLNLALRFHFHLGKLVLRRSPWLSLSREVFQNSTHMIFWDIMEILFFVMNVLFQNAFLIYIQENIIFALPLCSSYKIFLGEVLIFWYIWLGKILWWIGINRKE